MTRSTALSLVTVTSQRYLPGTLVMIDSFSRTNPWFEGDVVVIHDDLEEDHEKLLRSFPRVQLRRPSRELSRRIDDVCEAFPSYRPRYRRFFSLDVFALQQYERVLFCDSDMLFVQDIAELFERPEPLVCCAELPWFHGLVRDHQTYEPVMPTEDNVDSTLRKAFNAGLLLLDVRRLGAEHHPALLESLVSNDWGSMRAPHTDQALLNFHFDSTQHLVSNRYNFSTEDRDLILRHEGITIDDVKVFHFHGRPNKPWDHVGVLLAIADDPRKLPLFQHWFNAFLDLLSSSPLQMHREAILSAMSTKVRP